MKHFHAKIKICIRYIFLPFLHIALNISFYAKLGHAHIKYPNVKNLFEFFSYFQNIFLDKWSKSKFLDRAITTGKYAFFVRPSFAVGRHTA
jgi:hypothetical protein